MPEDQIDVQKPQVSQMGHKTAFAVLSTEAHAHGRVYVRQTLNVLYVDTCFLKRG